VMVFIVAAITDADTAPGDCPPETVALPCRPSGRTGSSRHGCHDRGARVTAPQRRDQIDGGLRRMGCLCRRRGVRAAVCGRSPRRKMRKCDVASGRHLAQSIQGPEQHRRQAWMDVMVAARP
jgi:hypothetical protein